MIMTRVLNDYTVLTPYGKVGLLRYRYELSSDAVSNPAWMFQLNEKSIDVRPENCAIYLILLALLIVSARKIRRSQSPKKNHA